MTSSILDTALQYSTRGWRVFPLHGTQGADCTCGTSACRSAGKHPQIHRWQTDASADPAVIQDWWRRFPRANVGVLTGKVSGIFVVDVDGPDGEESLFDLMQASGGTEPITLTVKTGRGRHLYFECPDFEVRTNTGRIAPGIDLRGEGGCVVAPPSRHASGAVYAWDNPGIAPTPAPDWLIAVIEKGRARGEPTGGDIRAPLSVGEDLPILEGTRNDTLFRSACSMRARGYELEEIQKEISVMNEEICEAPLSENEVATIATSASAYPRGNAFSDAQRAALMDNPLFWLPFNIKEFLGNQNVTLMTDRQRGWYICLIAEAWQNGGQLPNDPTAIHKLSRADCGYKRFGKDAEIVLREFSGVGTDATEITHPKLQTLFQKQLLQYDQRKAAGLSSARKRQEAKQMGQPS